MASTKGVGSASAPTDDSDLEDLIAKSPVEIDSPGGPRAAGSSGGGGIISTPLGCIQLCCYTFPRCSKCIAALLIIGFLGFVSNAIFNPEQKMGIMGADYSAITSAYDLSLSKVHHWCIQGDNESCRCEDPLEPASRSEFKSWNAAHKANKKDVDLYRAVFGDEPKLIDETTGKPRPPIDVAFLGESVVEAMDGRWLGKRVVRAVNTANGGEGPEARKKPDIGKVFERLFRKDKGAPVEGVALGIAGDSTANVLWRIQHDEMPFDFNPQVWWLVLGMNDLTRMQCSEEVVVLGILRVVEEIRFKKPDAKIVINSLLPMINYQRMDQPKMADFADFKRDKDQMRESMEIEKAKKEFLEAKKRKAAGGGHNLRRLVKKKKVTKKTKKQRQEDEDNAEEGPALEKALERRKKMLEARDKRLRNKVFRDNEKYRKKKPVSPLLPMIKKRVMPPVWPAVHLINDKLKEFAQKHESITFFDATSIFATDEGGGRHRLHNELISPRGHPSELGFAVWEGNIMGRLHKLLQEKPPKKIESPPVVDDEEEEWETVDDPEVEEIEPVHSVSHESDDADKQDGDSEEGSGEDEDPEGGKESQPAKIEQPDRDSPADEEKKESKKLTKAKKAPVKEVSSSSAEDESEEEEEEEEVASDKEDKDNKDDSEDSSEEEDEEEEDEDDSSE